jgi:class 3 adenylate cyclase
MPDRLAFSCPGAGFHSAFATPEIAMESTCKAYTIDDSVGRIDEILSGADTSYEEVNSIPTRDKLTFTNGFYVNCTCIVMDIRGSSELPQKYKRPTLAKIYRSYISEAVAVFASNYDCKEINIHGDSVGGVFNTPYKRDIDDAFSTVAQLASVVDILNCRYQKKANIDPIAVGIGMDYGRALMLKAGYKGSSINDVVWMGDVVNQATKLCSYGNQTYYDKEIMVSEVIYDNLNDKNKSLLEYNSIRNCYNGNVINTAMDEWVNKNCG